MRSLCTFIARCFSGGHNLLKSYSKGRVSMTTFCLYILYPNTLLSWSALLITRTFPVGNCAKIHKRNCEGEFRKLNSPPCVCPDETKRPSRPAPFIIINSQSLTKALGLSVWWCYYSYIRLFAFRQLEFEAWKAGIINFFARPFH